MKDTAPDNIRVKYYSSCLGGYETEKSQCDSLKVGDVVSFSAEITVNECPSNPKDWHQTFEIYPVGINESLTVDLKMICDCPCEKPDHPQFELNSPKCQNYGTYKCGNCECYDQHYGRHCECST